MYETYLNKIEDVGKLRNLKPGTIRTYQNNVRDFLKFINKHPDDLTCEDARDFLLYLKNKGDKAPPSTTKMEHLYSSTSVFWENFGMITLFPEPLMIMLFRKFFPVLK